jgi:hypothetical protein
MQELKDLLKKKGYKVKDIQGVIKSLKARPYGYGCGEGMTSGLDMGRAIRKGRKK